MSIARALWISALLNAVVLAGAITACTSIKLKALQERYRENFDGTLSNPGAVTVTDSNNFTFAMFGDTHIGNPGGEVMKAAISRAQADGDQFVIAAGDLTDNGDEGQYRQFKSVLNQINMVFRAAIGNHDIFFDGWDHFKNEIGRSIYSFDAGVVHFTMLDSANGVLGQDQLRWLENDLSGTSQPIKIVVSHFPPWNGVFSSMFKMSSDEEASMLKDILYRKNVQLMFSGHYHGYEETTLGRTKYLVSGAANNINDPGQYKHFIRATVTNGQTLTTQVVRLD